MKKSSNVGFVSMFWFRIGPSKDEIVFAVKKGAVEKSSFSYFICRETLVPRFNLHAYV
jgi:hypothetical protein